MEGTFRELSGMEQDQAYESQEAFNARNKALWDSIRNRVERAAERGKGIRLSTEETMLIYLMFDYPGN